MRFPEKIIKTAEFVGVAALNWSICTLEECGVNHDPLRHLIMKFDLITVDRGNFELKKNRAKKSDENRLKSTFENCLFSNPIFRGCSHLLAGEIGTE